MDGLIAIGASSRIESLLASVAVAVIEPPNTEGENDGDTGRTNCRLKLRVVFVRLLSVSVPAIDGSWLSVRSHARSHTAPPLNEPPCCSPTSVKEPSALAVTVPPTRSV